MRSPVEPLLVDTTHGPILGFLDSYHLEARSKAAAVLRGETGNRSPVAKWLGVPYAQAQRWKRCEAPESWTQPRECFEYGSRFPAPEDTFGDVLFSAHGVPQRSSSVTIDESSFVTNVYAPGDVDFRERLPVLAWIHGGGLMFGNSADIVYDPTNLIRHQAEQGRRVIIVSANYRLNILGFLSSKDLAEEASGSAVGNYGVHDCVAWLQWIQNNISAFGGDPSNVTVYGESAGSFLSNILCLHPATLFRRAILQSGAAWTIPANSTDEAEMVYQKLLEYHGISARSHPTAASRVTALRRIEVDTLLKGLSALPGRYARLSIEQGMNAIYTDDPISMIRGGKLNPGVESILIGSMAEEGNLFEKVIPAPAHQMVLNAFSSALGDDIKRHYCQTLDNEGPDEHRWSSLPSARILEDCVFNGPLDELADTLAQIKVNTHRYCIEASISKIDKTTHLGACHSIGLPFIFDVAILWDDDPHSVEARSASNISKMICQFATNGHLRPDWPAWHVDHPESLCFTPQGTEVIKTANVHLEDRLFWRDIHRRKAQTIAGDQPYASMRGKIGMDGANGHH